MIIFDLDGTLWDSSIQVAESWNLYIKKEYDLDRGLTAADIARNMGKTMDDIADDLFADFSPDERYALARGCEKFENGYISEHGGRLYEGVRETLKMLKDKGEKLAVVSNCQEGYIKAFMVSMDMKSMFIDYEEWGRTGLSKSENIKLVMERNCEGQAVYVGDIQKDCDSAHDAGIPCIHAAYGFGEMRDAEGRIDSFSELPAVLHELTGRSGR